MDTVAAYSDSVPAFLRCRPRRFVEHCIKRMPPVVDTISKSDITNTSMARFTVKGTTNSYAVSLDEETPSCECADWQRNCMPCKHMMAVFHHFPSCGWNTLSPEYTNFPAFIVDEDVVGIGNTATKEHAMQTEEYSRDVEPSSSDSGTSVHANVTLASVAEDLDQMPQHTESHCLKRLQSRLRQGLTTLSQVSYCVEDVNCLQRVIDSVQQHIQSLKLLTSDRFPNRNRRKILKKNPLRSALSQRLKVIRAKRRLRKMVVKQRKTVRGKRLFHLYCHFWARNTHCVFVITYVIGSSLMLSNIANYVYLHFL